MGGMREAFGSDEMRRVGRGWAMRSGRDTKPRAVRY